MSPNLPDYESALDKGSYERLVWHIKFVKDKLANGNN